MKQYLNFADNRQLYAHGAGAVHFHGVRPDAPGQWKWGTDHTEERENSKKHRLPNGQAVQIWQIYRSWIQCTMF